jgi:hypothetical protein
LDDVLARSCGKVAKGPTCEKLIGTGRFMRKLVSKPILRVVPMKKDDVGRAAAVGFL